MRFPKVSTTNINGLPLGYTEVEYLEASGTQYIDTGYIPTDDNFKFEIRMFPTNTGAYLGYRSVSSGTATGDMRWFFNYSDGRVAIRYGDGTENSILSFGTQTTHRFYFNGSSLYVDDVNYLTTTKKYATPVYKSFYLFSVNTSGYYSADIAKFVGRIYYTKIWDNDTLVRDFIPCLDSNNRPCMYDRVEGKPYYNLGTGEFSYGRKIYGVEYLKSTADEYIDTGIKFDCANTKIELKTYENDLSRIHSICGDDGNIFYYFKGTNNWASGYNVTAFNIESYMVVGDNVFIIDKNNVYLNGILAKTYTASSTVSSYNTLLFNRKTTRVDKGAVTMYYCKIWDNDVLVRDYVPVRDENNIGYMLDRVNHTLYENKGTGAFVVGGDTLGKSKAKLIRTKTTVSGLPYGFTEVEYLESNAGQYIDTGIQPTDTHGYRIRNTYTAGGGEQCAIGCMDSNNRFVGVYTSGNTNSLSGAWGSYVGFLPNYPWTTGTILDVKGNYKNNRKLIIDSTEMKDISDTHISGTIENTVYLFARHYGSTVTKMHGRMYSAEITNGQDVINKFIPALDSSNRPCMYDIIEGKAYYNQGTGEFTYGPKIIPVDYLESTGTQYIDTGFKPNNNTEYEVSGYMNPSGVFGVARWSGESTYDTFGAHSVTANPLDYYGRYSDNKYYNGPASVFNNNIIWKHTKNNISITNADNSTVYVNENITTATFQSTYNMWIFAFNNMGSILPRSVGCKMYYFKIWDNGTLIRDYIPVKDENGVGYMFDKLNHILYANAGTGNFVVGDEKIISKVRFIEDTSVISEYTKLKCLISSGTQYIDTGIKGKNNLDFDYKCVFTNLNGTAQCVGGHWSGASTSTVSFYLGLIRTNGNFAYHYDGTHSPIIVMDTTVQDIPYSIQGHMWIDEQYMVINGIKSSVETISSIFTSPLNIYLFGLNNNGLANPAYMKLYYCNLWDNNKLIRDYIPVIRNSDNKPGMFDRVTKTFFTNQGTGEFTYETL